MSEVQRFWCHDADNIMCVREWDYDNLKSKFTDAHAELAALREELAKKDAAFEDLLQSNGDMVQELLGAEQRNAELAALLHTHTDHVATLCDVMFRFGLRMYKEPERKIYEGLAQQQVVFAALKPTESGASDGSTCNQIREESGLPINNPCIACNNGACIDK